MPDPTLGLIMILRNEAHNLGRSLAPIAGHVDEITVVDTGSDDSTISICTELGAKVFSFTWRDDFSAARNFSINRATADWLLWLDGDNAIPPTGIEHIRASLPSRPAILWATERISSTGNTLWQKRCFPNRPEVNFSGLIHEQLSHPPEWPSLYTDVVIDHWGYDDPSSLKQKTQFYIRLLNRSLAQRPNDFYARFQLARCLINARDHASAEEQLTAVINDRKCLKSNPDLWLESHWLLTKVYNATGRGSLSRSMLTSSLSSLDNSGAAHFYIGTIANREGDFDLAQTHLERALSLGITTGLIDRNPSHIMFQCHYYLAKIKRDRGENDACVSHLESALALSPENTAARNLLIEVLMDHGHYQAARDHLDMILRLRPQDRRAQHLLRLWEDAA